MLRINLRTNHYRSLYHSLPVPYWSGTCISFNVHAGPYRSYRSKGGTPPGAPIYSVDRV